MPGSGERVGPEPVLEARGRFCGIHCALISPISPIGPIDIRIIWFEFSPRTFSAIGRLRKHTVSRYTGFPLW